MSRVVVALIVSSWLSVSHGFTSRAFAASFHSVKRAATSGALDMNDPAVVAEFNKIKDLGLDSVKYELKELGIPYSPAAGDMDLKLMLMEARIRLKGPEKSMKGPAPGASAFEKLCFEKPVVKKVWEEYLDKGDINAANTMVEYVNSPEIAKIRYGKEAVYRKVFDQVDALVKAPAFTSPRLAFEGFPPGMGEEMVKVSLKEFGEIVSLTTKGADDPTAESCSGTIESVLCNIALRLSCGCRRFSTKEAAEAAVAKWDGVDMGLGKQLTFKYLE